MNQVTDEAADRSQMLVAQEAEGAFTLILERYESRAFEHVVVPEGVTQILPDAFRGHAEIRSISLPSTLESLGKRAFYKCTGLEAIEVPDGVFEIGTACFSKCSSLRSVALPDALLRLEERTFEQCASLEELSGAGEVDEVGENAFAGCKRLAAVPFMANLKTVAHAAFKGCESLREVDVPRVSFIGSEAFSGCRGLRRVALPDPIAEVGKNAFMGCRSLQVIEGLELYVKTYADAFPRALVEQAGAIRPQDAWLKESEYREQHADELSEALAQRDALADQAAALNSQLAELDERINLLQNPTLEMLASM